MKILFLDDMKARHDAFDDYAKGHDVSHAWTAEDAIRMLASESFDAASLDHDLADEHYSAPYASPAMGGTAHSGRAVAREIARAGAPMRVMVHSFNPDGSREMCQILKGHVEIYKAPFGPKACRDWINHVERSA